MKMLTKHIGMVIALVAACTGCTGYKLGSLAHPQLHTIAVGEILNDTQEPYAGTFMKMKLPAAFMSDGSLKVVSRDDADAVVHTRIVSTTLQSKGGSEIRDGEDGQKVFRTSIFSLEVKVAYQVTRRGRETPLLAERTVIGQANFNEELDLTVTRQRALEVAIADAANRVATGVTEAW